MRFLQVAVPIQLEEQVLHPGGGAAIERCVNQWLEHMPNLGPAFSGWLAH